MIFWNQTTFNYEKHKKEKLVKKGIYVNVKTYTSKQNSGNVNIANKNVVNENITNENAEKLSNAKENKIDDKKKKEKEIKKILEESDLKIKKNKEKQTKTKDEKIKEKNLASEKISEKTKKQDQNNLFEKTKQSDGSNNISNNNYKINEIGNGGNANINQDGFDFEINKNIFKEKIMEYWFVPEQCMNSKNLFVEIAIYIDSQGNFNGYKITNYKDDKNFKILAASVVSTIKNPKIYPIPEFKNQVVRIKFSPQDLY